MKILLINKFYYLKGGSERYFFDLKNILEQNGHTVIPFSMQDEKNEISVYDKYFIKPVDLEKFSPINIIKFFHNRDAVRRLKALIKAERPDVAHLNNIAHQLTPAIIKVLKDNDIPVVMTVHDYQIACPNYQLFDGRRICRQCVGGEFHHCFYKKCVKNSRAKSLMAALESYLNVRLFRYYKLVDMFICPSRYLKEVLMEAGFEDSKIRVMKNFLEIERFRTDLPKPSDGDYLLYFGRLSPEKGIKTLIEAMEEIGGARLKIAGLGPEYADLVRQVADRGLEGKVEFVGYKYGQDLLGLISGARAVIAPSIWPENLPYNISEAMAMGQVVIASRVGGVGELIEDGETGFLFDAGDQTALAGNIKTVLMSDMSRIKNNARQAAEKLDPDGYYRQLADIYRMLRK